MTRGSGGQNLIGDELSADLGIREHELRAARSVDGETNVYRCLGLWIFQKRGRSVDQMGPR